VQVRELGDFSVTYRVAGFLAEVKHLLTARSNLRRKILDVLHGADIEIVSPTVMNQRRLPDDARIMPARTDPKRDLPDDEKPEDRIFDKAEEAGERESLKVELEEQEETKATLETSIKEADDSRRPELERQLATAEARIAELSEAVNSEGSQEGEKPAG
jgi:small-conductance mechanosensitive channel